jgi:hypothetical protein
MRLRQGWSQLGGVRNNSQFARPRAVPRRSSLTVPHSLLADEVIE